MEKAYGWECVAEVEHSRPETRVGVPLLPARPTSLRYHSLPQKLDHSGNKCVKLELADISDSIHSTGRRSRGRSAQDLDEGQDGKRRQ